MTDCVNPTRLDLFHVTALKLIILFHYIKLIFATTQSKSMSEGQGLDHHEFFSHFSLNLRNATQKYFPCLSKPVHLQQEKALGETSCVFWSQP